jgi:hypothetical protein
VCGGDLRAALWGPNPVGGRRLLALLKNLSASSAFAKAKYSDGQVWGNVEELLALNCELIDLNNRLYFGAHYKGHVWKPLEIRRPHEKRPELATPNEVHRFFTRKAELGNAVHSLS